MLQNSAQPILNKSTDILNLILLKNFASKELEVTGVCSCLHLCLISADFKIWNYALLSKLITVIPLYTSTKLYNDVIYLCVKDATPLRLRETCLTE